MKAEGFCSRNGRDCSLYGGVTLAIVGVTVPHYRGLHTLLAGHYGRLSLFVAGVLVIGIGLLRLKRWAAVAASLCLVYPAYVSGLIGSVVILVWICARNIVPDSRVHDRHILAFSNLEIVGFGGWPTSAGKYNSALVCQAEKRKGVRPFSRFSRRGAPPFVSGSMLGNPR